MSNECSTKYPIILVHGAGFRDDNPLYNYWGRIPKALVEAGASVHYSHQDSWGTIEANAAELKSTINAVLAETGAAKVNLIAHSKGGLESRYLISTLGLAAVVASLTTISTPHRGSAVLDFLCHAPRWLYHCAAWFVDRFSQLLGDKHPNFYTASRQLSQAACSQFNLDNPDQAGILYQSYTGKMRYPWSDPLFWFTFLVISIFEGPNDGLVAVRSAQWGDYKGELTGKTWRGVSHSDVIDLYRSHSKSFDMVGLYKSVVSELKMKGL